MSDVPTSAPLGVLDALMANIALVDASGAIRLVNAAWRRFADGNGMVSARGGVGDNYLRVCDTATGDECAEARRTAAGIRGVLSGESPSFVQEYPCHSPTELRWFRMIVTPLDGASSPGAVIMHVDVTERETQYQGLEAQFLQSQKMEAVGRLAGGVAHDFNNALQVIHAYGELLEDHLGPDAVGREHARQILEAARRAASLTHQLLALSRKQLLRPVLFDLSTATSEIEDMLRMTLGGEIRLTINRFAAVGTIEADRGQIQQILINLAINARDAMPAGGELVISTSTHDLAQADLPAGESLQPGPYAVLRVRDTGLGMDAATQARIFEPFFTTKAPGKGTGLGLSTVYGIVKQSKGFIGVHSAPGHGTEVQICLPVVAGAAEELPAQVLLDRPLRGGSETIFLVEDEHSLRSVVRQTLQDNGYQVLEAADGQSAMRVAAEFAAPIDLLLTDIILPNLSGRSVANRLRASRPAMRVIYMSGYADDFIADHGILDPHIVLLEKPFSIAHLLVNVRDALDSSDGDGNHKGLRPPS